MPRVTRAALRSMEQPSESDLAASTPLPQTPIKARVPLGEVAGNNGTENEATDTSGNRMAPAKKTTGKAKNRQAAQKANKQMTQKVGEAHVEILEDENQSTHSSAAEEASKDLLKDGSQGTHEAVLDSDQPQTPPSYAALTASRELSPKLTTRPFDSKLQRSDDMTMSESKEEKEDSFVAKIESRTPLKMATSEKMDMQPTKDDDKDDSFVGQIRTRTPDKRISRIEDSVEALDELEEEIEKVGVLLPASDAGLQRPIKIKAKTQAKTQAKPRSTTIVTKVSGSARMKKSADVQKRIATARPSTTARHAKSAPLVGVAHTEAPLSTSLSQQKPEVASHNPAPPPRLDRPKPQATLKKRISSVHKAPFQPHKSTKPPTRANFELPGDAFARKLKEQREERVKRAEEDVPKPRVFRARPVRMSHAPEVKLTAATKARLSMAKGEPLNIHEPSNGVAKPRTFTRPAGKATASAPKRLSTLSVSKRSTQPTANGSARLTRGPSLNPSTTGRAPSALGANRPSLTAEESAHQKLKGKEVFGRTKIEIMEREKAKKEKEDAARKARADAAERGRIASREWAEKQKAEKQKARKLEAGKLNEQGKTVEA